MKKKMFTLDLKLANGEELSEFDLMMLDAEIPRPPVRNELVEGIVVGSHKGGYMVDIGRKADAEVSIKECDGELEVGQTYSFLVFSEPGDNDCDVRLSHKHGTGWQQLREHVESGEVATAKFYRVQKNRRDRVSGMKAVIYGVRAFVPRSEILYHGNLEDLLEQELPVKVLEAVPTQGKFGQLILSQKQAVEFRRDAFLATINNGEIREGKVVKLIPAGALVDLTNGVTGLIHRTEVGADRNIDPAKVLKTGDTVSVKVLGVDLERQRVSLSRRAALQDDYLETVKEGDTVEGVVVRHQDYGEFVTIGNCIDGLLHVTELLEAGNGGKKVRETLKVGERVRVKVMVIDKENGRVALTRKGLAPVTETDGGKVA